MVYVEGELVACNKVAKVKEVMGTGNDRMVVERDKEVGKRAMREVVASCSNRVLVAKDIVVVMVMVEEAPIMK